MASLTKIYQNSFRTNFMLPAVTDYGSDTTLTYGEFAKKSQGYICCMNPAA